MSPIHDQSYRHYAGERQPLGRAWSVIAWTGIRSMLSRKVFLALMLLGWAPFIFRSVQIYFVEMYPPARQAAPVDVRMFRDFIELQGVLVFFVTLYVGAGLIATDRRANALQLYLSKPLLRVEYIVGKLSVLMFFLLELTLLPGLLLLVMQMMFSGSFEFVRTNPVLVPAIVLSSLLRVVVSSFTMLALSSLSKSSRYVAVLYAGAVFFSQAVFGVLRVVTGSSRVAWMSVSASIDQVTDVVFRQTPRYETPAIVCFLVLLGLVALSISVLERRVRGVEVVK